MSIDFGTDIYEEPIVAKTFLSEDVQEGSLRLNISCLGVRALVLALALIPPPIIQGFHGYC